MRTILRWSVVFFLGIGTVTCLRAQEQVTLRLVDWADLGEMTLDSASIAAFERAYPWISVLYEPNPGRQYEEKLLTGLAADAPPDVFLLDSKLIPTFTNKKVLLDLGPYCRSEGIDTSIWFPSALDIGRRNGSLVAFPKGFSPLVVYYNKDLFDAAGIRYPDGSWSWEDYLDIARRLTIDRDGDGRPEQYGCGFTNYYFTWIPWVWSRGGDVVDPAGTTATGYLNSAATEDALQFLIDLRTRWNVAPNSGSWIQEEKTGTNYALFTGGNIAMVTDGHWRLPDYISLRSRSGLRLGVAPLPTAAGRHVNVIYESGWCVPVNTRHPAEAVLLAAFMAGDATCRIRAAGQLEIPSSRAVAEETVRQDTTGINRVFVAEIPHCRQPWGSVIERFSEIEWTLQDAVDEVMLNGKPMHETMTRYAARVDAELAAIRQHRETTFRPIGEHSEILTFLLAVAGVAAAACVIAYVRMKQRMRRTGRIAFSFLAPSLIHLIVFVATPIVFAAWLSVHRWDLVVADQPFVGAGNFIEILRDGGFWNAMKNTLVFSLNVPLGMLLALGVALMLHHRLTARGILRTLYFLPSVTSFVAIALVWMWMYHPTFGMANMVMRAAGIPQLDWLNSARTAMMSIMIFSIWLGVGYQMVIFLAGLQGIPDEIMDAARIDGASRWQRLRRITLPLLRPTTLFILVTSLIGSFQVFTTVYVMTAGGPVRSTDVLVYHIYQSAWEQLRMGYASAMSWILFVMVMIATWIQFRMFGREVEM